MTVSGVIKMATPKSYNGLQLEKTRFYHFTNFENFRIFRIFGRVVFLSVLDSLNFFNDGFKINLFYLF